MRSSSDLVLIEAGPTLASRPAMKLARLALAAAVFAVSCGAASSPPASPAAPPPAPPSHVEESTAMLRHEALGIAIRDAIVAGELDTARHDADLLGKVMLQSRAPGFRERAEQMHLATDEVAHAGDLHAAAAGTGDLVVSCAACHAELREPSPQRRPPLESAPPPPGMHRHAWAVNALWDGVVGAMDERWRAGAESLADPANAVIPAGHAAAEGRAAATSIETLGRRAASARETAERAAIYGELLETCAACHAATR